MADLYRYQQNLVEIGSEEPTIWDSVFRCGCSFYGVSSASVGRTWWNRVSLAFWIVQLVLTLYICPRRILKSFAGAHEPESLCASIIAVHTAVYPAVGLYTVFWTRHNRENLQPLLARNGRRFGSVALPILSGMPELAFHVHKLLWTPRSVCRVFWSTVLTQCSITFFLIYMDLIDTVTRDQRQLLYWVQRPALNYRVLVTMKWSIRDRIRRSNEMFAQIFLMNYLVNFFIAIYVLGRVILRDVELNTYLFLFTILLFSFVQLYASARRCSMFKTLCEDTDQALLKQFRSCDDGYSSLHANLSAVFRFHDAWDEFKLGCFSHSVQNFLKFLMSGLTCIAIILQFDYNVIRTLNALSRG